MKFLPPHLSANAGAKARFVAEARAAAALDHPNVCTVYQIGETDDGRLFIAMPLYDGETLRTRLERGRLIFGEAIAIWEAIYGELGARRGYRLAFNIARAYEQRATTRSGSPEAFTDTVKALEHYAAYVNETTRRHDAGEAKLGALVLLLDELERPTDLSPLMLAAGQALRKLLPGGRVVASSARATWGRLRCGRRWRSKTRPSRRRRRACRCGENACTASSDDR